MHVIEKPNFITELADLDLEPMGAWELDIFYDNPDIGPLVGKAAFDLMAFKESITAALDIVWIQETRSSPALKADLDGQLTNNSVQFQLHIMDIEWQLAPFVCNGSSTVANQKYEGHWHVACLNPEECGGDCEGVTGEFSLTKIAL